MINLFKVSKEKQKAEHAEGKTAAKKQTAGELRLHRDMGELNLSDTCTIAFPNGKDNLMHFDVTVVPDEGYYVGGTFHFVVEVPPMYPHEPPKVKCSTMVYHPNIDLEGNVCLNILREDWKPVLNINLVIYGIYHLFTQPNCEDPLNHEAAKELKKYPSEFAYRVKTAMSGGYVGGTYFHGCGYDFRPWLDNDNK